MNRTYYEVKAGSKTDYAAAYEEWLSSGETLTASDWSAPVGITVSDDEINAAPVTFVVDDLGTEREFPIGTVAIAYLEVDAAAVVGTVYDVINSIETSNTPSRKDRRTFRLKVVAQYAR